jgi:hypothetical protein
VIDELMGHEATGRSGQHRGSAMGVHYRHTTPEMAARVIDAVQQRLMVVLQVAEASLENYPNRSLLRVFDRCIDPNLGALWDRPASLGAVQWCQRATVVDRWRPVRANDWGSSRDGWRAGDSVPGEVGS